jgi:hypothetical protein
VHSALDKHPAERDAFWALLKKHRVDAYFCGHEHLYNAKEAGGVRQVIAGSCGAPLAQGFGGQFFHFAKVDARAPTCRDRDRRGRHRARHPPGAGWRRRPRAGRARTLAFPPSRWRRPTIRLPRLHAGRYEEP